MVYFLITCHSAEILKFGVRRFVPEAIDIGPEYMCVYIKQTKQSPLSKLQSSFNESILVGPTVFYTIESR